MLTDRQKQLVALYVQTYPQLVEIVERAMGGPCDEYTLGNAMAALPYPPGVTGLDAIEIGKIGMEK